MGFYSLYIERFHPEKNCISFKNHILSIVLGIGDLILSIFSHQKSFPSAHMSRRKKISEPVETKKLLLLVRPSFTRYVDFTQNFLFLEDRFLSRLIFELRLDFSPSFLGY